MQATQRYTLTIHDLFTITDGGICGADAEVAILDGGVEIDRMKFSGKCQSKGGYSRSYDGKIGLTAQLLSGPDGVSFTWDKAESDPYQPVIAWRHGFTNPEREPAEVDVQDGRAEYVLSGPYRMAEGAKIEIIGGKVLWSSGRSRPS